MLQELTEQLGGTPVLADPAAGALGERLRENAPTAPTDLPLLIVQGLADVVIDPSVNDAFVKERCVAGQDLDYWSVPDRDHGASWRPIRRSATPSSGGRGIASRATHRWRTASRRRSRCKGDREATLPLWASNEF
jgi:hypothetical protein